MFWDGRAHGLEDQARGPVANPIEMDLPWDEAVARVRAHPQYPGMFERAFGDPEITEERIVQAIAQFERTLISANSKYDRHLREEVSLTEQEKRGERLFFTEQGDCFHCHGNILFTTTRFHDIGLDLVPADSGLVKVTGIPEDYGKFKTPSLRNVEYTAPYMHDGRFQTLREVIDHYDVHVQDSPNLDPLILARKQRSPLLDEQDKADLEAFLKTLSDPDYLSNPAHQDPFE
jgi:cytochrome c peroxidase